MKVALIGDVHANLPALEAVLADAHQWDVETIWNVGDIVGYGAFPDEVVQRLKQEDVLSIIGNYDIKVLEVKRKKNKWKNSQIPEKWFAFNWAYDNLSKQSRKYLRSLPEQIWLEMEGKRILLTHGSPTSNEEHIAPDTPEERLRELAEMANADVIICGHSHQPFKQKVDDVWFINTGSVGRPDDGDQRACYAILKMEPDFFQVDHYRVEYDVEREASAIREHGLPEAFAQMILQGRALDVVLETSEETEAEAEETADSIAAESVSSPTEEQSDTSEPETAESSESELEVFEAEEEEAADVSDATTVSEDDARLQAVLELKGRYVVP